MVSKRTPIRYYTSERVCSTMRNITMEVFSFTNLHTSLKYTLLRSQVNSHSMIQQTYEVQLAITSIARDTP